MTLIKDLIDIPDRVQKGDFVLKLTEGVTDAAETLRHYVVTPELVKCFDAALTFIRSAVQGKTSKATYLHGSFGSGKSHFMAVLHLILQGNPAARGIVELAPVIQKHNEWLAGKKFLLVPYHMIGAHDIESGVLGNYVDFIQRNYPDAPVPPVYMSATIIAQANHERASYGDELFFKRLNEGSNSGWGDLEGDWDASSYEAAAEAAPTSEPHLKLVSTLLKTVARGHAEIMSQRGGQFVKFDKGLSIISKHAQSLGNHALILFLDELILWLAMNASDLGFVNREAGKLTNLVEAQTADRPIPLVSFVARQRDLRELVGEHVPGAERLSFSDSLDWQQGRFDTITLEDRNLPAIAEKRVLRTKSDAARQELNASFEQATKVKDSVWNILVTHEGDRESFRKVYPFSPALVQTLIAVSSVLQRERTALKVMMQLLVDQRETLQVGQLIPVGDLFDVVAHGDEAFSQDMAIHFDNAKKLYHQKLLPRLEQQHGIRADDVAALPFTDPKRTAFRTDDRLIKTLLLAALVPEVESLRGINAEKLAALNHGTIKSPIKGQEAQMVLTKCRNWAASVGEIRIGDESNPTITLQLSGVDTASIIEQAKREDSLGNRVRRVRQMLFEQLDINGEGEFEQFHEFMWRNTKRNAVVIFRNIRELPDSSLENSGADWKLIIDYPFDDADHGPRDDLSVIDRFMQSHSAGSKTICWVPSFFSPDAQKDLGNLVILEHILTGDRFGQYSNHLSPQDRQSAKSLLENQRSVLKHRVLNHLDAAYGLQTPKSGSVDTTHDLELNEHYRSLLPGFAPQPPVAAKLSGAMEHLLSQALSHEFPAAPEFGSEVKLSVLKKVFELIQPATQSSDGRVLVDQKLRPQVREIANPLLIGEMGSDATHFVIGQHWKTHFGRKAAESGGSITVAQLRRWIDEPRAMGLPKEAQNLIILLFAAQTNRSLYLHGGPYREESLSSIPDDCELRTVELPTLEVWNIAISRAEKMFGLSPGKLLSVSNVSSVVAQLQDESKKARANCVRYCEKLRQRQAQFGIDSDHADRTRTALATQNLLTQLTNAASNTVITSLANAAVATSETAMGNCLSIAADLSQTLDTVSWDIFDLITSLHGDQLAEAQAVLEEVRQALASDEHVVPLTATLKLAQTKAVRLLKSRDRQEVVAVSDSRPVTDARRGLDTRDTEMRRPLPDGRGSSTLSGSSTVSGSQADLSADDAMRLLTSLREKLKAKQSLRVSLQWVIEEGGA